MAAPTPKVLDVYLDGVFIGQAEQSPQGALSFTYDDEYRQQSDATPLSLSMPLAVQRHGNKSVRAFLDGLLPDSEPARARWATTYRVSARNPFALLAHVGRDAAGAVQILPAGDESSDAAHRFGDIEWLEGDDFVTLAREIAEHGQSWDPGRFGGRWSLAGAQPKIALFRDPETGQYGIPLDSTPTNCIVKPSFDRYSRHHVNEAMCLIAAHEVGLLTAEVSLLDVADVQALVSHRYDRILREDGHWSRVHQEDMCQALSVPPDLKYQSQGGPGVADIGELLQRFPLQDREISAERFLKALAFNVLIGGTDAHAKNYSLILIGSRAQFAPLYDVASAACYPQFERLRSPMNIGRHEKFLDVVDDDWKRVAKRLGVRPEQAVAWVEELRAEVPAAFERAIEQLPQVRDEAAAMAERIIEHVNKTWRPDLTRDPRRNIDTPEAETANRGDAEDRSEAVPHAKLHPEPGPPRIRVLGKTTRGSNQTSFKARQRAEADIDLD